MPETIRATTPPWKLSWQYKKELRQFLITWKGANNPSGCVRLTTDMDPPGCLTLKRVGDIMVQLSEDEYWRKKDPVTRRNYLWNAPRYRGEMRKIVMYFEEQLNPTTIVYWADLTTTESETVSALTVRYIYQQAKDTFVSGDSLAAHFDGDEQAIWTLAFIKIGVLGETEDWLARIIQGTFPIYDLRNKEEVTRSALDRIFHTARMLPLEALKYQIDPNREKGWSQLEEDALWQTMRAQTETLLYAHENNVDPRMAKTMMNSAIMALGSVGGGGIRKVGGARISMGPKGTSGGNITIGQRVITMTKKVINRIFQRSKTVTNPATIDEALVEVERTTNMVLRSTRHSEVAGLEGAMADMVEREILVASETGAGAGTLLSDQGLKSGRLTYEMVRKATGIKRTQVYNNLGIPEIKRGAYPKLQRALRDWDAHQTLASNGVKVKKNQNVILVDNIVDGLAKNQGISKINARAMIMDFYNTQKIEMLNQKLMPWASPSDTSALRNLELRFGGVAWGPELSNPEWFWLNHSYFSDHAMKGDFLWIPTVITP